MPIGKKVLFGVALLLCASLAFAESVRVKSANVNVRSTPAATAKVVAKLPQGKMLEVIEVSGQWTRITDGAITGWVATALLERVAEAPAAAPASSGASRSSGTASHSSAPPAHRASHKADSDEKPLNIGIAVDLENNSVGIGFGGRVLFTPIASRPEFRLQGIFDLFPKSGTPWDLNANALYVFRQVNPDFHPYVGAGIIYSHSSVSSSVDVNGVAVDVSASGSSTNIDVIGGVTYKQRFFGDVRIVLADGTPLILSVGVTF